MAKKVVVPEGSQENGGVKVKRKRSKCCTCCIAMLLAVIIILAGAFAVGWVLGDKFFKAYFDMSMGDAVGVLNGMYYANDKKVVKNPYTDDDLDKFYGEIKSNILLKEDADVDFGAALTDAIKGMTSESDDAKTELNSIAPKNADISSSMSSVSDVLGGMLSGVFTRENIDIVKLNEYSEEHDEYIFDLYDKGLAAFINAILGALLDGGIVDLKEMLGVDIKLSDYVRLKQVTFKAEAATNEIGESVISATTADVTVWLGMQGFAGKALTGVMEQAGMGWAGFAARGMGNMLLPKNFYATVTVPLSGDAKPQLTLNAMNEKKRNNTYKLVDGVMGLTGSDITVDSLMESVMETMRPMLSSLAEKADLTSAAQGNIKFDLIQTMTDMLNASLGSEPITKADFMYLLQALLGSDPDARLAELRNYLYKGWYRPENNDSATPAFDPADKTGMKEVDYEKEFVKEIENKYCLDLGDKSLKEVLDMLGISLNGSNTSAGSSDLLKQINTTRFHQALAVPDENIGSLVLEVTDRMLAAAFDGQMDDLLGTGGFGGMSVGLDAITFVSTRPGGTKTDRIYALLAVQVDISSFLGGGDDSMLGKLASGILPEKLVISIFSDVTPTIAEADRDKVTYEFNDYSNTERIVDTLSKIMPSLDLSSICKQIDDMLYSMIDQLNKKLTITLVPSNEKDGAEFTPGEMQMPNIFKLVSSMVLVDGDGKAIVTDVQFKNVVNGLENTDGVDKTENVATSYSGFLDDVTDKYYLNPTTPLQSFDELTSFVSGGMDTGKFRFKEASADGKLDPLVYDTRGPEKLEPAMSGAEMGALIADKLKGNSDGINEDFKILSVKVAAEGKLLVTLAIDISTILPDTMHSLITADKLYATAIFDTQTVENAGTDDAAYKVDLVVNQMTERTQDDAFKIVKNLSSGSTDIEGQIKSFGKLLYTTLNDLSKQMDDSGKLGSVFKFEEEKTVGDKHEGGLVLVDFYSFLGSKLGINMNPDNHDEEYTEPSVVQQAIQGMYERNASYPKNENNYVASFGSTKVGNLLINEPDASASLTSVTTALNNGDAVTDKAFVRFFDTVNQSGSGIASAQSIVVAPNSAQSVREWMTGRLSVTRPDGEGGNAVKVQDGKAYLLITFELAMSAFSGGGDDTSKTFLPDKVYATVVYEKPTTGDYANDAFTQVGIVYNNMSAKAYKVMFKLMQLDAQEVPDGDTTVNIFSIARDSAKLLNDFRTGSKDFTLANQSGSGKGFGTVQYS